MNHSMSSERHAASPRSNSIWYREFYVWLLILFPVMSIFMGITTISLAITSYDGLVVDDYYKKGLVINEVLARDEMARQLGLQANLNWQQESDRLYVDLSTSQAFDYPAVLNVKFMHATRGGVDQAVQLVRNSDNLYRGNAPSLEPGHWHVEIAHGNWRLLETHWEPL